MTSNELFSVQKKTFSFDDYCFFFLFIVNIAELIASKKTKNQNNRLHGMKQQKKNNLSRANDMFDNLFD